MLVDHVGTVYNFFNSHGLEGGTQLAALKY
jgi:hypothetical protein